MRKKAFFHSISLYSKANDSECDYNMIPNLLKDIINNEGVADGKLKIFDLTPKGETLHTVLDIFEYQDDFLFARASKQKPTGSMIGRDYTTLRAERLLPGIGESEKGIESYTYIYINYTSCIMEVISAQGAPNEKIISDMFKYYNNEYCIKLTAIPNANGIENIYGKENTTISSLSVEIPYPDPVILEGVLGIEGTKLVQEANDGNLKVTINLTSSFEREKIAESSDIADGIIDALRGRLKNFKKAKVRGKTDGTKSRDYNFYEENFYYPVEIPSYHILDGKMVYYNSTDLIDINRSNLMALFYQCKDVVLPLANRNRG